MIKIPTLFSDDEEIDSEIYKIDASNELSYEKMCLFRHLNHPRKLSVNKDTKKSTYTFFPLCGTKTGWSHCKRERRQSELKEYGVGLVLYFQFQKYLAIMMIVCCFLSIPSLTLFYHGSVTFAPEANHEENAKKS